MAYRRRSLVPRLIDFFPEKVGKPGNEATVEGEAIFNLGRALRPTLDDHDVNCGFVCRSSPYGQHSPEGELNGTSGSTCVHSDNCQHST